MTLISDRLHDLKGETWDIKSLVGSQASRAAIVSSLSELCKAAKENDKIFVFFAGHGVRHEFSDRTGWIIPADGQTADKDPDHLSWVRLDEFSHVFDENRAKHVLVAMDCCYGGRLATADFGLEVAPADRRAEAYAEALLMREARLVITSGLPDEEVSDGPRGENSPFARAFAEALFPPDGAPVTGFEIFTAIRKKFIEEGVRHLPVLGFPPGTQPGGDVVFFPK